MGNTPFKSNFGGNLGFHLCFFFYEVARLSVSRGRSPQTWRSFLSASVALTGSCAFIRGRLVATCPCSAITPATLTETNPENDQWLWGNPRPANRPIPLAATYQVYVGHRRLRRGQAATTNRNLGAATRTAVPIGSIQRHGCDQRSHAGARQSSILGRRRQTNSPALPTY